MGCCCSRCFTNKHIQNFIETHSTSKGNCDYCGAKDVALIDTDVLGEYIRKCIGYAYVNLEEGSGAFFDPEFRVYCGPGGVEPTYYSVRSILTEEENVLSDAVLDTPLVDDMMQDSSSYGGHGDYDEFCDPDKEWLLKKYSVFSHDADAAEDQWNLFKELLCRGGAFSNTPLENPAAQKYLSAIKPYLALFAGQIQPGDVFYRARTKGSLNLTKIDAYKELGPAPQHLAKSNRMSKAGVPRLYVSSDTDTALTECRITGEACMVAKYIAKKVLPIIDLSGDLPAIDKSIFDPTFSDEDLWLGRFLRGFVADISKPVVQGEESFYYEATQIIAEYIRVMPFAGICYKSSVGPGKSYVFFCGPQHSCEAYPFLNNPMYDANETSLPPSFTDWFKITKVMEGYAESHFCLSEIQKEKEQ